MSSQDPGATRPEPQPGDDWVKIGYIRRAHGINGAVIVRVLNDEMPRFVPEGRLGSDDPTHPELTIVSANTHKDGLLVRFAEVPDRNHAEALRGTSLLIDPAQRRDLETDEFWPEQLVGLPVVDPDGNPLGSITDLVTGDAQDRLVVTAGDTSVEVPFVAAIVTTVDLERGLVIVDAPAGLFTD